MYYTTQQREITTKFSKNLRNLVYERDSYTCVLCERPADDLHHVVHRSQGGRDNPHNLVAVCRFHHSLLHGQAQQGTLSTEQARRFVAEYISACYAEDIRRGEFFATHAADMSAYSSGA